jgi:predicted ATPase
LTRPSNPVYHFLHDKVQQAAYTLIAGEQKRATHLKIGRLLLQGSSPAGQEEKIFEITNHLNMGRELIDREEERVELAQLNLLAGRKAKSSAAFETALRYFSTGLELLPAKLANPICLNLALSSEAAEAAFASTDLTRSEELAVVLQHAKDILDKVQIYGCKCSPISPEQDGRAVRSGLEVLELLGVSLNFDLSDRDLALPELEELEYRPVMSSPEKLAAMRILIALAPPVFQTRPEIFPQVIRTQIDYCMKHGLSALAAVSYGLYGFFLLAGPGENIEAGYQAGLISLRLLELSKPGSSARGSSLSSMGISVTGGTARTTPPAVSRGHSKRAGGDLQFLGYNVKDLCSPPSLLENRWRRFAQLQAITPTS